jgi:hypothetical protein
MHEALRRRILRRLEALPEARLYQVLDYIEFLESRYGEGKSDDVSTLQTLAERLEDGLRKRTLSPNTLREAFQVISAADKVLHSISETGKNLLAELQPTPESKESASPRRKSPVAAPRGSEPDGGGGATPR